MAKNVTSASKPRPPTGVTKKPSPPTGSVKSPGNIPSPGTLLGAISSLSSGLSALSSGLENISGLLDPNIELFIKTFDQQSSLEPLTFLRSNNLSINDRNSQQSRDKPTVPARDFNAANGNKQPNLLRTLSQYNYVITLGILTTDQVNNPLLLNRNDFSKIILQSGGGGLKKRHQIFDEGGDHAEYYIENLNIEAVIAPNPNTGVGLGVTVDFDVVEPYSMGNFTEALVGSAAEGGFANFTTAPFGLKINFQGWDDRGVSNSAAIKPYFIPIHIINVEFSVTNSGSRYQVKAIAINDVANSNMFNEVKTDIKGTGVRVDQILENSASSITAALNDRSKFLENPSENSASNQRTLPYIPGFDKYIIAFPTSVDGINRAIENGVQIPDELTVPEELGVRFGIVDGSGNVVSVNPDNPEGSARVVAGRRSNPESSLYDIIKAYTLTQVNEIGRSTINEEPSEGSNQDFIDPAEVYDDAILRIARRNLSEAGIADRARSFTFSQGTPVTEIIENVLMDSSYVQNSVTEEGENQDSGSRNWFRIKTYTFIDNNDKTDSVIGRKPKIYVYAVFPYEMDQAIHAASGTSPPGTENLRNAAIKEYNYIYTGKNEDVLDFNIEFNYAFMQSAYADFGNFSGSPDISSNAYASNSFNDFDLGLENDPGIAQRLRLSQFESPAVTADMISTSKSFTGGKFNTNVKKRTAQLFHDRLINSNVDMLSATMTIWGDPYFLPSINGNYVPKTVRRMLNDEGRMQYLEHEVMIIVNFLSPIDYRKNGALMEFSKIEERFSGLYRVITVRSIFNNGEFKQELQILRRHGQVDDPQGGAVMRTSSSKDRYDPYSSNSKDPSGRGSRAVSGVPLVLPQFGRGANVLSQFQGLTGSPQEIFQTFSSLMPPQILNFQSQFGQIKGQVAKAKSQIDAVARSLSAAQQRAGGAFASQTSSALAPASSTRPRSRPINSQTSSPVRRPPTRPGQNVSGTATAASRIDRDAGGLGATGGTLV
jgi:hypothetical protein